MSSIPNQQIHSIKSLYDSGYSAKQISLELHHPLNAVYYAMRKHKIARRNAKDSAAAKFAQKPLSFSIPRKLTNAQEKLRLLGTTLYWTEGYKTTKSAGIDFANSDEIMIKLFLRFLREVCRVDESRLRILLYSHDQIESAAQMHYWSTQLSIPIELFSKPYIVHTDKKLEKKRKMPYGLVHLRYADKKLLLLVLDWIEDLKK